MSFPTKAKYVVIGTGIHGLSTAWHLAEGLKKKNSNGSNSNIVVIDKSGIASGASGIACGVVRNNYFQPAMRELMAHSVEVWESDPKAFHYHPIGYMQISPESMRKDVTTIYEQQKTIGYESFGPWAPEWLPHLLPPNVSTAVAGLPRRPRRVLPPLLRLARTGVPRLHEPIPKGATFGAAAEGC